MDLDKHDDVVRDYCRVEQTQLGNILDAQDDYGTWHLAIVVEDKVGKAEKKLHFLPFKDSKRDEIFKEGDSNKIGPAFAQTDIPQDPEKCFKTLREYYQRVKKQNEDKKPK